MRLSHLHGRATRFIPGLIRLLPVLLLAATVEAANSPYHVFAFNPEFRIGEPADSIAKAYLDDSFSRYRKYPAETVPEELKAVIRAPETVNPFRQSYPEIYASETIEKLMACEHWAMVPVQVDNNPDSLEWLVSASLTLCASDSAKTSGESDDKSPHVWLIQQVAEGEYRILIEGDDKIIINNEPPGNDYREIVSSLRAQPIDEASQQECGETRIRWQYADNHYKPSRINSTAAGCREVHHYGQYEQFTGDYETTRAASLEALEETEVADQRYLPAIEEKAETFIDKLEYDDTAPAKSRSAPARQQPEKKPATKAQDEFDLEKLIRSGALDALLK